LANLKTLVLMRL